MIRSPATIGRIIYRKNLAYARTHGFILSAGVQDLLGVNEARARYLLQKMQKTGQLRKEGRYKDARYLSGYQ